MRFAGAAGLAAGLRTFNGGAAGISAPCVTEDVLAQGADLSLAVAGPKMRDFVRRRPPMRCRRASATSVRRRRVRKSTARRCAPRLHERGGAGVRTHSTQVPPCRPGPDAFESPARCATVWPCAVSAPQRKK